MVAFLCGVGGAWLALVAWMAVEELRSWWDFDLTPAFAEIAETYDLWWLAAVFIAVPVLACWASMELIRVFRRPRMFDRAAPGAWFRKTALGAIIGVVAVALVGVSTAFADWTHAPDVVNVIASAALPTLVFGWFLPRIRPGRCITCQYDTRGLPFPDEPGPRRCPECGSMVA